MLLYVNLELVIFGTDDRIYFVVSSVLLDFFFFFQAEDGIRDLIVTGVQTCALPISDTDAVEPALAQVDRLLLAVLDRCRAFLDRHLVTFRVPELERWQHAAAAALVGARWGVAGLRTVIADTQAPLGRRYFAFLGIAERHPDAAWPLFERYLVTPGAHHAFVAAAVEATRYYSGRADVLISLFERVRGEDRKNVV